MQHIYYATYCALCPAVVKHHIITVAITLSCHNNFFLINDAPLFKFLAFNVALYQMLYYLMLHCLKLSCFKIVLFDVPLFSCAQFNVGLFMFCYLILHYLILHDLMLRYFDIAPFVVALFQCSIICCWFFLMLHYFNIAFFWRFTTLMLQMLMLHYFMLHYFNIVLVFEVAIFSCCTLLCCSNWYCTIVRKWVLNPLLSFQNHAPITRIFAHFLKSPISPHLTGKWAIPSFLINRNATVKLSSINTIHVKQQHNVGFFIFNFTLKYMLGNVYINKIHAG